MLRLAGVVFCFAGRGLACIALLSLEYYSIFKYTIFKYSASNLIVSAHFAKSVVAIFHPVWKQYEGKTCLLVV